MAFSSQIIADSLLEAELQAILAGLTLGKKQGFCKIIVLGDPMIINWDPPEIIKPGLASNDPVERNQPSNWRIITFGWLRVTGKAS